jgi:hypothetical protein
VPQDPAEPHEWYSVVDSEGTTWIFDLTFLTSNWTCIWGNGCPGIHDEPQPELEHGCCTYGAHFADKADRQRVLEYAGRLTVDNWQHKGEAAELGGPIWKNEDGEWVTRLTDDACIFLNRPGFSGGKGCALHGAALQAGERFIDWKPEVCWQLPVRLEHHYDDNQHLVYTLREWKRRDWGEGGADLHWWCTDTADAFIGDDAVYLTLRDEIVQLTGEWPYAQLVEYLERRRSETFLPHPALKSAR